MAKLKREIIDYLTKKLHKSENAVRIDISNLRTNKFPGTPINSVAHIYAKQHGTTVYQKLTKDEKLAIPHHDVIKTFPKVAAKKIVKKESAFEFLKYETTDHFIKGHLREINRTYNQKCYTASFILARKIVENFIIDILIAKFPEKTQANKELYYDTARGRFKDFSVILDNLNKKKNDFGINKTVVERLYAKAKALKADANDKTHSWFHLVEGQKEIDDLNLQTIIELIKQLQK